MKQYKEQQIIALNDVIYSKKSKLSKKDIETLILIREEIRNQKTKKGLIISLKKIAKLVGLDFGDGDD